MTTVAVLPTWVRFAKIGAGGARPTLVSRASERQRAKTRDPGVTRQNRWIVEASRRVAPRSRVSLRSPGTRVCEVAARKANRWPYPDLRCQTAQCCSFPRRFAAPGFVRLFAGAFTLRPPASPRGFGASGRRDSSDSVPPMRGDGAPTGALFFRSRLRRATTRSRGDRDPSRGALPWEQCKTNKDTNEPLSAIRSA